MFDVNLRTNTELICRQITGALDAKQIRKGIYKHLKKIDLYHFAKSQTSLFSAKTKECWQENIQQTT